MRDVTVTLMNTPSVVVDGEKKVFPYRKVEGLFYYICVRKRITRDEAIGIFWVDCDETSARKNLRDALYHIKKDSRAGYHQHGWECIYIAESGAAY